MQIKSIEAFQIYDSRGNPTVECEVALDNGVTGAGLVPAGASTGQYEALELRDGDGQRWRGNSVYTAIDNIEHAIAPALRGWCVFDQQGADNAMIELDGTDNKSSLGANAILAVSMAIANAAANLRAVQLYQYLGEGLGNLLPLPQIQIFGGGAHSGWRTDIQDFLIIPVGAATYQQCLEMTHNVYHAAGDWMLRHGKNYGVAEEGGFWPAFDSHRQILDALVESIELAGYRPGHDVGIALDIAASELYHNGKYELKLEQKTFSSDEFSDLVTGWCSDYPIISLEDPMSDIDLQGWQAICTRLGRRIQIIGDDLFTTSVDRIEAGVDNGLANAVLIKLNQIGSVSETLQAIRTTQAAGWLPVVSARSGETEDTFIAHLAVATNAGQLKVGSFARSERTAKWNELLRIERCLTDKSRFVGGAILHRNPIPLTH